MLNIIAVVQPEGSAGISPAGATMRCVSLEILSNALLKSRCIVSTAFPTVHLKSHSVKGGDEIDMAKVKLWQTF